MWRAEVPCLFRFVLTEIQRDFVGVFNKRIIPLALFGYEMIIANSKHSLPIYIYIYIYIYIGRLCFELAIIISYPKSASGIILLLKTPTKSRWISVRTNRKRQGTSALHMSHVYQNCQRADWMNKKSKRCSDEHFQKVIGILGFYTAGQLKKPSR